MKKCTQCKIIKEYSEFYKGKGSDGYRFQCKSCVLLNNKKWREENKEKSNESSKKWRIGNKEKVKTYDHKYRQKESRKNYMKEYMREYNRKYYENNKENLKEKNSNYKKEWYKNNPNYYKTYFDMNKDRINKNRNSDKNRQKANEYKKRRRSEDMVYRISHSLSGSLRNSLKRRGFSKKSQTYKALGCSFYEFKVYIELKFESWMTWENYGKYNGDFNYGWDIDHIIPISSAKNLEDIISLYHYTNLQPLCSKINRDIKMDKLISM